MTFYLKPYLNRPIVSAKTFPRQRSDLNLPWPHERYIIGVTIVGGAEEPKEPRQVQLLLLLLTFSKVTLL